MFGHLKTILSPGAHTLKKQPQMRLSNLGNDTLLALQKNVTKLEPETFQIGGIGRRPYNVSKIGEQNPDKDPA